MNNSPISQANAERPRMLVVGNGFDLAHDLPTKYQHMLNELSSLSSDSEDELWLPCKDIKRFKQNPFIRYFMVQNDLNGWTDFETEIREIVHYFKRTPNEIKRSPELENVLIQNSFRREYTLWRERKYPDLWDSLKKELDELIEYIDKYLYLYLPSVSPASLNECKSYPRFIYGRRYDYFLSFNYTNTYLVLASAANNGIGIEVPLNTQFIHGCHSYDGDIGNIVLGIEDDDPNDLDTVYFKKYFQRIQKRTGRELYNWIDQMNAQNTPMVVDIFGHSLDTTDRDILLTIFENSLYTNIYYLDQDDYERKVINLIRLYESPDEFTKRYYNNKIRLRKISTAEESIS